jgi:hypothetical protein
MKELEKIVGLRVQRLLENQFVHLLFVGKSICSLNQIYKINLTNKTQLVAL